MTTMTSQPEPASSLDEFPMDSEYEQIKQHIIKDFVAELMQIAYTAAEVKVEHMLEAHEEPNRESQKEIARLAADKVMKHLMTLQASWR